MIIFKYAVMQVVMTKQLAMEAVRLWVYFVGGDYRISYWNEPGGLKKERNQD